MNEYRIVMVPGDGIGPEVSAAVQRILEAAGARIAWIEQPRRARRTRAGADELLPEETVETIREHGVALKGPCTTPMGKGFSRSTSGCARR